MSGTASIAANLAFDDFKNEFDDARGLYEAWSNKDSSGAIWRSWSDEQKEPRLYFATQNTYPPLKDYKYFAVDGMGREVHGTQPFECTIHPYTGKFERLCVQALDSICSLPNSNWDRTIIRQAGPQLLLVSLFTRKGIHKSKRGQVESWSREEWMSVVLRWIPSSLIIMILIFIPHGGQPADKNPHTYLPFRYNGYRYPRIAKNIRENRKLPTGNRNGHDSVANTDIGAARDDSDTTSHDGLGALYRAFRPRYLCYLKRTQHVFANGEPVYILETKSVTKNDFTPYVFISYTKEQFNSPSSSNSDTNDNDNSATSQNMADLYADCIGAATFYANQSGSNPEQYAFWLDEECQPMRYTDDDTNEIEVSDAAAQQRLADRDVYTMSDVIRGAESTIIITRTTKRLSNGDIDEAHALKGWGARVWTLPEVILSKGHNVVLIVNGNQPRTIPKVRLAELAWSDGGEARQLVEHYTTLHLSRLELVSIAFRCLQERSLLQKYAGDRSYALMGLLRLRPKIDTQDSAFQAFARLSLPQDNDRLMERLICLLPENPGESWDRMSDVFNSTLWDIYPSTQICGIGENDTIIVDGFKGAMIQWSMFSTVQTMHRATLLRKLLVISITGLPPVLLFIVVLLLSIASSSTPSNSQPLPTLPDGRVPELRDPSRGPKIAGYFLLALLIILICSAPAYIPHLYNGKLYEAEPCLFGIEGYMPLEDIEDKLFGFRPGRLKWSTYGSPLSRHGDSISYAEKSGIGGSGDTYVYTYPVEAVDPCQPCDLCMLADDGRTWTCSAHVTISSVQETSRSPAGQMKVFMLIDTYSMTVTLFESRRPPVALLIGGLEGGMKRALACSFDITTGIMYRETVLRIPSNVDDKMLSLPRVRLGLRNPRDLTHAVAAAITAPTVPDHHHP